jgi:hypothetical protein
VDNRGDLARRPKSPRQRIVVLTFPTAEQAEAWDAAGQPLEGLIVDIPDPETS